MPARQIVVGDLVLLEAGNYIPADMRLVESANLRIEEAALTGESVPVDKDANLVLGPDTHLGERENMAYSGTLVSYGRGKGLVVATGMKTEIGQIAELLQSVEIEATPLQRKLDQLGKVLGWAALAVSGLVFLLGWARGIEPLEIFLVAVSLAVLDNDADFEAAEDGSYRVVGDPTEVALIVAANQAGARRSELEQAYPRIDEIPFDSSRKRMTTVHKVLKPKPEDASPFYDGNLLDWEVAATKGAPDVVLDLCTHYQTIADSTETLGDEQRQLILDANKAMAKEALRVIALAYRVEQDLIFVGLIGMIDPARPEVPPALEMARAAGVRTVMITGDYPDTARAIAEDIGLMQEGHQILTGRALESMEPEQLMQEAKRTDVFARVTPEHKVRIVNALKAAGEVVAMTGDGVNDAPALKRADIGIAMGITGTDVAKETADMVLTEDKYASIVAAIDQGRVIYANIRKFVFYLLSCNGAEILTILTAILVGVPSPLTAIQLLWLNLVTDGAPALALGMEKGEPDIMDKPPRPVSEAIINPEMWSRIGIQTVAIAAVTLTAYFIGRSFFPAAAGTMAFATISFSELLRAFTSRSDRYPLLKIGIFTNKAMLYAVSTSALLLLAVIYVPFLQPIFDTVPLNTTQWAIILPLLLVPAVVAEMTKAFLSRGYNLAAPRS